jgi:diguanylate cyclase (GGDEF)-like protein
MAGRGDHQRDELAQAAHDLEARLERIVHVLREIIERAQEHERRDRQHGELAATLDLDEVLARVLEAAGAIPGVEAALVTLVGTAGNEPIVAALGLSEEEEATRPASGPGLAVPLPGETGSLGTLRVFPRTTAAISAEDRRDLEELAARAGPAIENARRFREARQLADLDALTGLHNRRYFHETLAREVARAHRYDRRLALIVCDLDDFKAINDRIGHLAGDTVLAEAAEVIRSVVRSADVACRVGGDEFAVILPESGMQDAEQLSARLRSALEQRKLGEAGMLRLSAGVAELTRTDDARSFFERADDALYGAKGAGKGRSVAAGDAPA